MKKKILFAIAVLLGIILFVFGVPIAINECYRVGGYITLWNAADVLGYYGTILGAVVSIGVLAGHCTSDARQSCAEHCRSPHP